MHLQFQLLSLPLQEAVLLPTAKLQRGDLGAPIVAGQLEGVLQLPNSRLQAVHACGGRLCTHLGQANAFRNQLSSMSAVQGIPCAGRRGAAQPGFTPAIWMMSGTRPVLLAAGHAAR